MAECRRSKLNPDGHDVEEAVNVPGWTNDQDSASHQKRSNIIGEIIENQTVDQLRTILESCWDVNELLDNVRWGYLPALHQAASHGWTEGVKMLLDAEAKCTTTEELNRLALTVHNHDYPTGRFDFTPNLLSLALQDRHCPIDLITLLLQHGADPNDHDDQYDNIPLLNAIENNPKYDANIVQLLLHHGANPNVEYSLNIGGCGPVDLFVQCTALHEAARRAWIEVLKMLFDAGAKYIRTSECLNPLAMAVHNPDCPPELIKLLLKHGADPNDHDEKRENIPLFAAIANLSQNDTIIVELLLEHGAIPNIAYEDASEPESEEEWDHLALDEAAMSGWTEVVKLFLGADYVTSGVLYRALEQALIRHECQTDLVELLLKHGADLNHTAESECPLIYQLCEHFHDHKPVFLKKSLDLFFLHGGNINMECVYHKSALECTVTNGPLKSTSSTIRWLIRHGADASNIKFTQLKGYVMSFSLRSHASAQIPLILLQAGVRVSYLAHTNLSNMAVAISVWLEDGTGGDGNIRRTIQDMWSQLEKAEQEGSQRLQSNLRKPTFPKFWNRQMIDLQEFSDESLHDYPEETYFGFILDAKQKYQNLFDHLQRVLEFLSQPLTLQSHCRLCVRENLVSLQPSVVKTLPLPAGLKRYILCHGL